MPKTKLEDTKQKKLAVLIAGTAAANGMPVGKTVAHAIEVSELTAMKRVRDPGTLTIDELVSISKRMHITADELRAAISFGG